MTALRTIATGLAAFTALAGITGTAHADDWGAPRWSGGGWGNPYDGNRGWRGSNVYAQRDRDSILVERTCNGRFAAVLENRVQREASEGDIDRNTAWRMHREIDRLEDKGRHECSEGDWRAARGIGENYMRISRWIDSEAGRPQRWDDDRRGW